MENKDITGITFTGDIHIKGDMFNIHDNQNVTINMSENKTRAKKNQQGKKDTPVEKKAKPRETMTFKRGKNVVEGHISLLYNKLTQEKWIDGYEANFKALFSSKKDEDCEMKWISSFGKGTLVWLFKILVQEELVEVPNGYTIPAILEGHFKDKDGQWLKGLDKGDKPNEKAKTTIIECVKLMKINPKNRYDEQSEEIQLKYDPFDHQDLNLHKK